MGPRQLIGHQLIVRHRDEASSSGQSNKSIEVGASGAACRPDRVRASAKLREAVAVEGFLAQYDVSRFTRAPGNRCDICRKNLEAAMLFDERFDLTPVGTTGTSTASCEPRAEARPEPAKGKLLCRWVLTEAGALEMRWTRVET
jgi:hypothetical protein